RLNPAFGPSDEALPPMDHHVPRCRNCCGTPSALVDAVAIYFRVDQIDERTARVSTILKDFLEPLDDRRSDHQKCILGVPLPDAGIIPDHRSDAVERVIIMRLELADPIARPLQI